jgi:hypothetical protein
MAGDTVTLSETAQTYLQAGSNANAGSSDQSALQRVLDAHQQDFQSIAQSNPSFATALKNGTLKIQNLKDLSETVTSESLSSSAGCNFSVTWNMQ